MKTQGMVIRFLFMAIFLFIATNCVAQNKAPATGTSFYWRFIEKSEMPPESEAYTDAFLQRFVLISGESPRAKTYMSLEGWENGWTFSVWGGTKWLGFTNSGEVWLDEFVIADLNSDKIFDLILYETFDEYNYYGEEFPQSPRLFYGDGETFKRVEMSCNETLKAVFASNLNAFKINHITDESTDYLNRLVSQEEMALSENCAH